MSDDLTPAAPPPPGPTQPIPAPQVKQRRMWRTWQLVVSSVVALFIGVAAGGAGSASDEEKQDSTETSSSDSTEDATATTEDETTTTEEATTTRPEPTTTTKPPREPTPQDFTIELLVIESQCFDSAGANVTIEPSVKYDGPAIPGEWVLSYEIQGGENVERFSIEGDGGDISFDQQLISTASCDDVLTAVPVQLIVR